MCPEVKIPIVAVDKFSRVAAIISRSLLTLNRSALTAAAGFGVAAAAIGGIGVISGKAFSQFADFEYQLRRVAVATGTTGAEMMRLSDELEEVARTAGIKFGVGATRAAAGLEALVKAGFKGKDAIKALDGALEMSIITGIDATRSSKLLVQALKVFGMEAKDTAKVVDALVAADLASIATADELGIALGYAGGQARIFGMDLYDTLTAVTILTDRIGDSSKAGRYLRSVFTELIQNAETLGFSVFDVRGQMLPLEKIVTTLSERFVGLTAEERAAALETMGLSSQAATAIALLSTLGETVEEATENWAAYEDQIRNAGDATEIVSSQLDTSTGKIDIMSAAWEDFKIELGGVLAPGVTTGILGLTNIIYALSGRTKEFAQSFYDAGATAFQTAVRLGFLNVSAQDAAEILLRVGYSAEETAAGIELAYHEAIDLQKALDALKDKDITVTVRYQTIGRADLMGEGLWGRAFQDGITIPPPVIPPGYTTARPSPYMVGFQEGGVVTRPTLALLGERGPEAVVPLREGGRAVTGGPIHVSVTIPVTVPLTQREFEERVELVIDEKTGEILERAQSTLI